MPRLERVIADPPAPPRAAAAEGGRWSRALHATWVVTCLAALLVLVGVRWLRYTNWSAVPPFDRAFRELMVVDSQAFLWPWAYTTRDLRVVLLALGVVAVGLHRRLFGYVVASSPGGWRLTPAATSVLLGALLWLQYGLDLDPTVAMACGSSLLLLAVVERRSFAATVPPAVRLLLYAGWLAGWTWAAWDPIDRIAIAAWALFLAVTQWALAARLRGRDLLLLRVVAVIPANLLAATLPLVLPWHGGTFLGAGLAYDFCEVPNHGTVYAAIPVCDSIDATYEKCRDGRVVEYDAHTLQEVAVHRYFSPAFHGRLEMMECLDDEVQVAVQGAEINGRGVIHSVLAFPVADPQSFNPIVAGPEIGNTIAYDRAHEALFYTSEFSHRVVRYDRRTQQVSDVADEALRRRWIQPALLTEYTGSSILYTRSIHPGRNLIFLGEWMQGRYAYAIDLTTFRVVARYDVGGGGALGIMVDPDRDRLMVSSVWGIEVFDLTSGALITRRREGLGNRPAILDAERNLIYVASTVEGKIRILDRDSFDTVGQIPIGLGTRFAHLSLDGRRLFASSVAAHFVWDADALAPRR